MISDRYKTIFFFTLILSFLAFVYGLYRFDANSRQLIKASTFFPIYMEKELPDITIFDEKGVEIKRDSLSKGLVALHFWATWCSSCERELDSISKLTEKKISLYCISIDDDPTEAIEYLKKLNLKLPLYFDRNSVVAKRLGSSKFPETYILYNGKIILKFEGPRDWENKELIEFIYRTAYVSLTSIIK